MVNSIIENQTKCLNAARLRNLYINDKLLLQEDAVAAQGFHVLLWADV
jgi:hypothetical protein